MKGRLHDRVVRILAEQVLDAERQGREAGFPNEDELCRQLGVSRTVLRESMKVLADKGMVEMKPRWGTRATPRSKWRLLDPDILAWEAEAHPAPQFLRDLCEVRLAIEPTAAGFAAVRATESEMEAIGECLRRRESMTEKARFDEMVELDLCFHAAIVEASHNPLFRELNSTIREPFRTALGYTSRVPANIELGLDAHRELMDGLRRRDPLQSKAASEKVVGLAMLAVEAVISAKRRR